MNEKKFNLLTPGYWKYYTPMPTILIGNGAFGVNCGEKMKKIYLDHNATTPVDPAVLDAMLPYLKETFGNASSIHRFGREAHDGLTLARDAVADILGCTSKEVIFTSGATESDNMALRGVVAANRKKGNHIIVGSIEHPAVLDTAQALEKEGVQVTYLAVDTDGLVDPAQVAAALRPDTVLVSVMYANNETGVVQPIAEIGKLVRDKGVLFHTDAVQAAGKFALNVDELHADLMSLSGHKIYGPKGIGVLYVRKGTKIAPLIIGGHHEFNKRAGTENMPGIVGFAKAFELAEQRREQDNRRIGEMRDYLEKRLLELISRIFITAQDAPRLPNTSHMLLHFIEGEGFLMRLALNHGIGISTGSACTSGTLGTSHVLDAMGLPKQLANSGVRISLGRSNTMDEMEQTALAIAEEAKRLRDMSPLFDNYYSGRMAEQDRRYYDDWATK